MSTLPLGKIGPDTPAQVARALDDLPNRIAWRRIQDWLRLRAIPGGQWSELRTAIWLERKRLRRQKQKPTTAAPSA
jgi:hypothetical protein